MVFHTLVNWGRLEPHSYTTDIAVGLAAEVADPLWFLLRQWQLGELTGDDGGSPAAVDISTSWSRFTRLRAEGADPPSEPVPIDDEHGPFERMVEREALIHPDDPNATSWVAAVHAGRSLRRHLVRNQLGDVADRLAQQLTDETRFDAAASADAVRGGDDDRYWTLLRNKVIDGAKVLKLVREGGGLPGAIVGGADAEKLERALTDWQSELDDEWGVTTSASGVPDTWVKNRLEYAFSIGAPPLPADPDVPETPGPAEVVLTATEYDGTGLTWHSLDLDRDHARTLGAEQDTDVPGRTGHRVDTVLASPLRYASMPADRFWEIEDARVALSGATAGPTDLARMLAVDFALVYSPDWFIAPVELPVGSVGRIDWVIVRDTFGVGTLVGTSAPQTGSGVGRQFQPSNLRGVEGDNHVLVVLPSALATIQSAPQEDVAMQRDEVANVAWSIEKLVLGPTGRGVARPWFRTEFQLPDAQADPTQYELVWRLATPVANSWLPLVSVRQDGDEAKVLRKARLLETTTNSVRSARSQIMRDVPRDIADEEVTRSGVRILMVEQLARWHDGTTHIWRGREKRLSTGEAASGLRFDATTPKPRGP